MGGARALLAPREEFGRLARSAAICTGTLEMFERAGFVVVRRTGGARLVVRRALP
ncbi:MAG: hypothetical protein ACRDPT_14465 [Streptomycetales bacterium]